MYMEHGHIIVGPNYNGPRIWPDDPVLRAEIERLERTPRSENSE
jgi:hypothetical protein